MLPLILILPLIEASASSASGCSVPPIPQVNLLHVVVNAPSRYMNAQSTHNLAPTAKIFHFFSCQAYEDGEERKNLCWMKRNENEEFFSEQVESLFWSSWIKDFYHRNWYKFTRCTKFESAQITVFACDKLKLAVMAFRGTVDRNDVVTDVKLTQQSFHNYFGNACETYERIVDEFGEDWRFYVTGHSLGGAVASMVMLFDAAKYTPDRARIHGGEVFNAGSGIEEVNIYRLGFSYTCRKAGELIIGSQLGLCAKFFIETAIRKIMHMIMNRFSNGQHDECVRAVNGKLTHHHIFGDPISAGFALGNRIDYRNPSSISAVHGLGTFQLKEEESGLEQTQES